MAVPSPVRLAVPLPLPVLGDFRCVAGLREGTSCKGLGKIVMVSGFLRVGRGVGGGCGVFHWWG